MASEYDCRICGWEFSTMSGLWEHIPAHTLTQAQYGTLSKHEKVVPERDSLRAALAQSQAFAALWKRSAKRDWRAHIDMLVALCTLQGEYNTVSFELQQKSAALAASRASEERLRGFIKIVATPGIIEDENLRGAIAMLALMAQRVLNGDGSLLADGSPRLAAAALPAAEKPADA